MAQPQTARFSEVSREQRVPPPHPLPTLRPRVEKALRGLGPHFARLDAQTGRPAIPPERWLRALQILSSGRRER